MRKIVGDADASLPQPPSCIVEPDPPELPISVVGFSRCFLVQENVVEGRKE
jgi:hypothetical protein